jgi:GH25 family lysozyme M1 (1,4-beta-N-acetylmuramidase)
MNGIDIYEGDNISDWNAIKGAGVQVVIQKATQGVDYLDKLLDYRYPRIKEADLKFGAYHFAGGLNGHTPEAEAENFLKAISGKQIDTVLFLDIENYKNKTWDKQEAINFTNAWFNYVKSKGYKVGLYTGEYFYDNILKDNISDDIVLWIAKYSSTAPALYPTKASWQYSEIGNLNGAQGDIDLNNFISNIFVDGTIVKPNVEPVKPSPQPQYWNGYNMDRSKSFQHLLNGLGLKDNNGNILLEDGKPGTSTFQAASKLPIAKVQGYHNDAYTDFIQSQLNIPHNPNHYYDQNTANLVGNFQLAKHITADQKVGIETLKEILKQA